MWVHAQTFHQYIAYFMKASAFISSCHTFHTFGIPYVLTPAVDIRVHILWYCNPHTFLNVLQWKSVKGQKALQSQEVNHVWLTPVKVISSWSNCLDATSFFRLSRRCSSNVHFFCSLKEVLWERKRVNFSISLLLLSYGSQPLMYHYIHLLYASL